MIPDLLASHAQNWVVHVGGVEAETRLWRPATLQVRGDSATEQCDFLERRFPSCRVSQQ